MIIVTSNQQVALLPNVPGQKNPAAAGYTDVVLVGKPNNVLRVRDSNLHQEKPAAALQE